MVSMSATGSARPKSPWSRRAVEPGRERHAHAVGERLADRAAKVAVPVATGVAAVDARHAFQITFAQRGDLHAVARERFEVGAARRAVVIRVRGLCAGFDRRFARRAKLGFGEGAVEHVRRRKAKTAAIEEAEQRALAPQRGGADLGEPPPARLFLERALERRAEPAPLHGRSDAEGLEAHRRLGAAELAFEHAAEHVAGETAVVLDRELQVTLRVAAGGGEPP